MWDQFDDLGEYEPHAIDTSDQGPEETLKTVVDAVAGGRYRLR